MGASLGREQGHTEPRMVLNFIFLLIYLLSARIICKHHHAWFHVVLRTEPGIHATRLALHPLSYIPSPRKGVLNLSKDYLKKKKNMQEYACCLKFTYE